LVVVAVVDVVDVDTVVADVDVDDDVDLVSVDRLQHQE